MEYRQNASYNDIEAENNEEEVEEGESHGNGNTRLPFGLCERYGITIQKDWTPRDAWNALKGIGIKHDEVIEDVKDDGKVNGTQGQPKTDEQIEEEKSEQQRQENIKTSKEHLSEKLSAAGFSSDYINKVHKAMDGMNAEQAAIFAKYAPKASFGIGKGCYNYYSIFVPDFSTTKSVFNESLGYDWEAETFFHEFGHFISHQLAKQASWDDLIEADRTGYGIEGDARYYGARHHISESAEGRKAQNEDGLEMFNKIFKEAGLLGYNSFKSNFSAAAKEAVHKWVEKEADFKQVDWYKKGDFLIEKPEEVEYDLNLETNMYKVLYGYSGEQASLLAKQKYDKLMSEYQAKLDAYNEAESSGANQAGLEKYEAWRKEFDDAKKSNEVRKNRIGFLTDFIGGITRGRINPYNNWFYGHEDKYHRSKGASDEPFAEFASAYFMNDKETLGLFEKYLPRCYNYYSKILKESAR